MLTSKQKLYALLDVIAEKLVLLPNDAAFYIDPKTDLKGFYQDEELAFIFLKLQNDEKVLKVTQWPSDGEIEYVGNEDYPERNLFYRIYVYQSQFNEYHKKLQQEHEYKAFSNKLAPATDIVYEISYNWANEIILNRVVKLAQPNSDSINNLVFAFLYKNPNKNFTREQIQEELHKNEHIKDATIDFYKIVEKLGFTGDIRKVFFGKIAKNLICFRNPITKIDLERLGNIRIEPISKTQNEKE